MEEKEIINFVSNQIEDVIAGANKEYQKLDFKQKWKDLADIEGRNEFLKDITAMANTSGPDGFIIYGFNAENSTYHDSVFSHCGLKDESTVNQMITKYLSHTFDINFRDITIDGKRLSIVHIPDTPEPPYFIKNYQTVNKRKDTTQAHHKVFIRKGSSTYDADKYDIDYMYRVRYGRTRKRDFDPAIEIIDFGILKDLGVNFEISFLVENRGLSPFAITKGEIIYQGISESHGYANHFWLRNGHGVESRAIVVQTGNMEEVHMKFKFPDEKFFKEQLLRIALSIYLNNGQKKEFIVADQAQNKDFKGELLKNIRKMPDVI